MAATPEVNIVVIKGGFLQLEVPFGAIAGIPPGGLKMASIIRYMNDVLLKGRLRIKQVDPVARLICSLFSDALNEHRIARGAVMRRKLEAKTTNILLKPDEYVEEDDPPTSQPEIQVLHSEEYEDSESLTREPEVQVLQLEEYEEADDPTIKQPEVQLLPSEESEKGDHCTTRQPEAQLRRSGRHVQRSTAGMISAEEQQEIAALEKQLAKEQKERDKAVKASSDMSMECYKLKLLVKMLRETNAANAEQLRASGVRSLNVGQTQTKRKMFHDYKRDSKRKCLIDVQKTCQALLKRIGYGLHATSANFKDVQGKDYFVSLTGAPPSLKGCVQHKEQVLRVLYVMDNMKISQKCYHALAMAFPVLPRLSLIKKVTRDFCRRLPKISPTKGFSGVFVRIREVLEKEMDLLFLLDAPPSGVLLQLKVTVDRAQVSREKSWSTVAMTVLVPGKKEVVLPVCITEGKQDEWGKEEGMTETWREIRGLMQAGQLEVVLREKPMTLKAEVIVSVECQQFGGPESWSDEKIEGLSSSLKEIFQEKARKWNALTEVMQAYYRQHYLSVTHGRPPQAHEEEEEEEEEGKSWDDGGINEDRAAHRKLWASLRAPKQL